MDKEKCNYINPFVSPNIDLKSKIVNQKVNPYVPKKGAMVFRDWKPVKDEELSERNGTELHVEQMGAIEEEASPESEAELVEEQFETEVEAEPVEEQSETPDYDWEDELNARL